MPGTPTPILGLTVPTVGGDANTWGTELNLDLAILDSLGALSVVNVNSNYAAILGSAIETLIRVNTGAATIVVTLPTLGAGVPKVFTVKKIDSGVGQISIVPASGTIDGQASYVRAMQYGYVRVAWNGVGYDVIGNN